MPALRHGRAALTAAGLILAALLAPASGGGPAAALPPPSCMITLRPTPFAGGNHGAEPAARLIQASDGSLCGTTPGLGGDIGLPNRTAGTVFRLSSDGKLTTLYAFTRRDAAGNYLGHPDSSLVRAPGGFYGHTRGHSEDGVDTPGIIFRITPAGMLTTVFSPAYQNFSPGNDLSAAPASWSGVLGGLLNMTRGLGTALAWRPPP